MIKINFTKDVLPHLVAVGVFLLVTIIFFSPFFFEHKSLEQHDIQQGQGQGKSLVDYRAATGKEGLWSPSAFSGMPAYLVSLRWSDAPMGFAKKVMALFIAHPVANIFLAFVCYYILLLSFRVRPYLAIAGALAFGLSSYVIIGLGAGHNSRIGAIAFMPLVVAGIHLVFSKKRVLGFAVTALGLALHFRENHLQITYYLLMIVLVYGLVQLVGAYKEKKIKDFAINMGLLVPAATLGLATYFGQFWAINEYSQYTIRGKSELVSPKIPTSGLSRSYAFDYSNGILEPMTLLVPNFYGGSTSHYLVQDQQGETYKALVNASDNQLANQLVNYTSAYWGPQSLTAPYYAGAIIVFLFVVGILLVEKKWLWWILPLSAFCLIMSWGESFSSFNYLLFDYLPGYNKFRSVTFALVIILFFMPLLGMMGLEKFLSQPLTKELKKKLLIAFGVTGGLCLLLVVFAGLGSFARTGEGQLPSWFTTALQADRKSLFRSDAFRSFSFILSIFILLYFNVNKKVSEVVFLAFLAFMVTMDLAIVDKRYFGKEKFQRKSENTFFAINPSDEVILKDKSYYRVYNLQGAFNDGRTSYYHYSIGGYHGAKLRRYQDLYDSCMMPQTRQFMTDAQAGTLDFTKYSSFNMLNVKYLMFGQEANKVILNPAANGPAWFVQQVLTVSSPNEELKKTGEIDTKKTAVIQQLTTDTKPLTVDSTATITLLENTPPYMKYESNSSADGVAVFSEIYYPKGWHALIDGKETDILRADYVLRALNIPAGKHTIEFRFEPKPYLIGNKVTAAANWLVLLVVVGCVAWNFKKTETTIITNK
ncbi:MAG: YfhO family protein [Bacteroidetes bacterium]|nr:YfhO family protein [Bacteroidota bacterium]MBS1541659.1 YfhO family protein [Bacteroidota bacterium]